MRALTGRAYHLTHPANLASIRAHGILAASVLLELAGVAADERRALEREQRRDAMTLANGVVLSDQRPMPPEALARCLEPPLVPGDWYALLDGFAFFWLDVARLERLRRAYLAEPRVLLTLDAAALVAAHADAARVTAINSGNARRAAAYRGRGTFVSYDAWRRDGWAGEPRRTNAPRPPGAPVVELAIVRGVPDAMRHVLDVRMLAPGEAVSVAAVTTHGTGAPAAG